MLEIFVIILFIIIGKWDDWKYDRYMLTEGFDIEYNLASLDQVKNHLTNQQVKQNTMNGKYNVPKNRHQSKY